MEVGGGGDRTGAPGAIGWSWQARALRFSPRFCRHRAVMSGAGPAVFAPPPPPSGGHVRRGPCGFRPAFTTVGRSWQAQALPFSPRPHHRRPVMSGAPLAQVRSAPTTVIPAKAGIQVGVHGNGRAGGGVDGHVGHRWRTRVCGVLCGGTDLDPRLRGDDGGGGRGPRGGGGPAFGVVKVDPRLRGDDGREGVWRWAEEGTGQGRRVRWGGHGRRGPSGFRPASTTIGRSWQASASPFSPRPHDRRPVMSGATSAQARPAPTTVIPAKAGIQVGVHGNGRAGGGVDGHVGHRWRTRVCGVLCGGTDLDPRLRGDDGGGGREPRGGVGPAFEAVKVDPRRRGDDGREGVWKWAKGGSDRGAGCDRPVMSGAPLAQARPAPTTVIPAKAGIQVGVHGNGRAAGGVDGHVGHRRQTRVCGVLCGGTDLDPRLRGDDGGGGREPGGGGGPAFGAVKGDGRCMGWVDGS